MKTIRLNPNCDQSRVRLAARFAMPVADWKLRRDLRYYVGRRIKTDLQRRRLAEAVNIARQEARRAGFQVILDPEAPLLKFPRHPLPGEDTPDGPALPTGSHRLGFKRQGMAAVLLGRKEIGRRGPHEPAKPDRRFRKPVAAQPELAAKQVAERRAAEAEREAAEAEREAAVVRLGRLKAEPAEFDRAAILNPLDPKAEIRAERNRAARRRRYWAKERPARLAKQAAAEQERQAAEAAEREAAEAAEAKREAEREAELKRDPGWLHARRQWLLERAARYERPRMMGEPSCSSSP